MSLPPLKKGTNIELGSKTDPIQLRGSRRVSLIDTKSLLAKLMATENITVLHENLPSAYFDLRSRTLHCPMWKDMTGEIYDLLMGHEISHALHTPRDGWHDAVMSGCKLKHEHVDSCADMNFKDFLNVCEDARIERLIKQKFPGLRPSFATAYKDMFERDMFKVKDLKDLSKLNLIDRVNLWFKVGAHVPVKFTKKEQKYVARLETAETWEEVVQIAREIYEVCQNQQDKIQNQDDLKDAKQGKLNREKQNPDKDDGEGEEGESSGQESQAGQSKQKPEKSGKEEAGKTSGKDKKEEADEDSDDSHDGNGDDSEGDDHGKEDEKSDEEGDSEGESSDEEEQDKKTKPSTGGKEGGQNNEPPEPKCKPQSVTDKAFREAEQKLVDKMGGRNVVNADMPKADLDKIIIQNIKVVELFERVERKAFSTVDAAGRVISKISYEMAGAKAFSYFQTKNKGYVNLLFKEFEMRKNAKQYYRATVHHTGELDSARLARYKFTNDIFRRVTEVPKGKNHAMVFFLDMSGSMDGMYLWCAIEQIITMAMFCNKARIPYEVYGFADRNDHTSMNRNLFTENFREINGYSDQFHLRQLLTSSATRGLQRRAMNMLSWEAVRQLRSSISQLPKELHELLNNYRDNAHTPNGLGTSGTPLSECIIASRGIIENLKRRHHADIVNVVYFSDGDGHAMGYPTTVSQELTRQSGSGIGRVVLQDAVTKRRIVVDSSGTDRYGHDRSMLQSALVMLVKEVTGCRHIGYYITSDERNIKSKVGSSFTKEMQETLDNMGFCSAPVHGFDNYYYLTPKYMGHKEIQGVPASSVGKDTLEVFQDSQRKKKAARVVLSKFAAEIASNDGLERLKA